jgi:hypothetical protein
MKGKQDDEDELDEDSSYLDMKELRKKQKNATSNAIPN